MTHATEDREREQIVNGNTRLARTKLALDLRPEMLQELDVAVRRFGPILHEPTRELLAHDTVLSETCATLTGSAGEGEPDNDERYVSSSLLLQLTQEIVEPVTQDVVALLHVCLKRYCQVAVTVHKTIGATAKHTAL